MSPRCVRLLLLLSVASLQALLLSTASRAQIITVYHDRAEWEAAVSYSPYSTGSWQEETFDDATLHPSLHVYRPCLAHWVPEAWRADTHVLEQSSYWVIDGNPVAFGANWDMGVNGSECGIAVGVYSDGEWIPLGEISHDLRGEFWGFVGNARIQAIYLYSGTQPNSGGQSAYEDYYLDNMVWALPNTPPVAQCTDVTIVTQCGRSGQRINPSAFDGGSYDPDGHEPLSFRIIPDVPFRAGTHSITLIVMDSQGGANTCTATLNVVDPPVCIPSRFRFPLDGQFLFPAPIDTVDLGDGPISPLGGSFQDSYGQSDAQGWTSVDLSADGAGNFAQLWPYLPESPLVSSLLLNPTPRWGFVDDGYVVPETGGSLCYSWCYGPSGYVVNSTGGLAGPGAQLHNEIWSPVVAWPSGYEGGLFSFQAYLHESLQAGTAGIMGVWHVRSTNSTDPDDILTEPWKDRGVLLYGGPGPVEFEEVISDLLTRGTTYVQLALGVVDYGDDLGFSGNDASPGPYFDNVGLVAFRDPRPALYAREADLAQDAFPESGVLDHVDLGMNSVRLDMASAKLPGSLPEPGDVLAVNASPMQTGSSFLGSPQLHYRLKPNPLFDSFRAGPSPFDGQIDLVASSRDSTRWYADLPDSGFFFPGDVLHYFIRAEDTFGGVATLPSDTTGFSSFDQEPGYDPLPYPLAFTVRALPTMRSANPGDQPPLLYWMDSGREEAEGPWLSAFNNMGYRLGIDFDFFYTNEASAGLANGLAGQATAELLSGYDTILYNSGSLTLYSLSSAGFGGDPTSDVALLDAWLRQGGKNLLITGDNVAYELANAGSEGQDFLSQWLSVVVHASRVQELIGTPTGPHVQPIEGPVVRPVEGNTVITQSQDWITDDALGLYSFDAVEAVGSGVRLAEYRTVPDSPTSYIYAAAVLNYVPAYDATIIYLPYDLARVTAPPMKRSAVHPRVQLLEELLAYFGHGGSGVPTGVETPPVPRQLTVNIFPNPFNPRTTIEYSAPHRGNLSIRIYDLRGALVRTILDGRVEAGPGKRDWAGLDHRGHPVSSGVYVCEIRGFGNTSRRKLTLLK